MTDITGLALAAGRGDRTAMTEFVRATQRDVIRFLTPLTAASDVEDLTQETFLRALRSLPEFAGRSSARTWLFAIARRVAADHVRSATRRPRVAAVADRQATAEAAGAAGTPGSTSTGGGPGRTRRPQRLTQVRCGRLRIRTAADTAGPATAAM